MKAVELPRLEPLDSKSLQHVERQVKRLGSLENLFYDGLQESAKFLLNSSPSFLDFGSDILSDGLDFTAGPGTPKLPKVTPKKAMKEKSVHFAPSISSLPPRTIPSVPNSQSSGRKKPITRRQSSSLLFNSVVQKLHQSNVQDWEKQNCHYCGRCRPLSERFTCKNQYCSLQGQRVKYMCKLCYDHQTNYYKARGLDVKNILGDVHSSEWYCPACIIWEDFYLPHPGICCCSFRRNRILCPLHEDCHINANGKRTRTGKQNYHCKPYKQKIKGEFKTLKLDLSKIRIGSKPYRRTYGEQKLAKKFKKKKRDSATEKVSNSHLWLGDVTAMKQLIPFIAVSPSASAVGANGSREDGKEALESRGKGGKSSLIQNAGVYFNKKQRIKRHKTC
uniref:Uncharacterized protein n=1 Tax=Amorphochlora amoebiformis TaxID=1561963 RepID=A0A7S0CN10_9EUKA